MYHAQSDTDKLYIPIKESWQSLLRTVDYVRTVQQNLLLYWDQSEERLLRFPKSEGVLAQYEGPVLTAKKQKKQETH